LHSFIITKEEARLRLRYGGLDNSQKREMIYALLRLKARSDPRPPTNAMIEDGSGTAVTNALQTATPVSIK
jgi:hypothetical protein